MQTHGEGTPRQQEARYRWGKDRAETSRSKRRKMRTHVGEVARGHGEELEVVAVWFTGRGSVEEFLEE